MEPKSESLADKTLDEKATQKPEPRLEAASLLGKIFTLMKKKREQDIRYTQQDQLQLQQSQLKELEMRNKILESIKGPKEVVKDEKPGKKPKLKKEPKKKKDKKRFGYPDGFAGFLVDATIIGGLILKHKKDAEAVEKDLADVISDDILEKLLSNKPETGDPKDPPVVPPKVIPPDTSESEAEAAAAAKRLEDDKKAAEKLAAANRKVVEDGIAKAKAEAKAADEKAAKSAAAAREAEAKRVADEAKAAANKKIQEEEQEKLDTAKRKKEEEEKLEAERKEKLARDTAEQKKKDSEAAEKKAKESQLEKDKKLAAEAAEKSRLAQENADKAKAVREAAEDRANNSEIERKATKAKTAKEATERAENSEKERKALADKAARDIEDAKRAAVAQQDAEAKRNLPPEPTITETQDSVLKTIIANPVSKIPNSVKKPSATRIFPKDLNNFGKNKKYGYLDQSQTYAAISQHEGGYDAVYGDTTRLIPDPKDPKKKIREKYNISGPTVEQWSEENLGKAKKLTELTFKELLQFQKSRKGGHSAVGKIQFLMSTLFGQNLQGSGESLFGQTGLEWTDTFSEENQEKLIETYSKLDDDILMRGLKKLGLEQKITPGMKLAANFLGAHRLLLVLEDSKEDPTLSVRDIIYNRSKEANEKKLRKEGKTAEKAKEMAKGVDITLDREGKPLKGNVELALPGSGATFLDKKELFVLEFAIKNKYLTPEEIAKTVPSDKNSGTTMDKKSSENSNAKADGRATQNTTNIYLNQTQKNKNPPPQVNNDDDRNAHQKKANQ